MLGYGIYPGPEVSVRIKENDSNHSPKCIGYFHNDEHKLHSIWWYGGSKKSPHWNQSHFLFNGGFYYLVLFYL